LNPAVSAQREPSLGSSRERLKESRGLGTQWLPRTVEESGAAAVGRCYCYSRRTMGPKREIAQRELRNNISAVLREVQAGSHIRITVRGRAVADLVPVSPRKDYLTPGEVRRVVREAPLDLGFAADVEAAAGATIDEL
jgi:prevent-host-death family protein